MVLLSVAASVAGASAVSGAAAVGAAWKLLSSSKLEHFADLSTRAALLARGNSTLNEPICGTILCQMMGMRRRWRNVMLVGDVLVVSSKNGLVEHMLSLQSANVRVQDVELTIETACSQVSKFWLENGEQAGHWACEMESAGRCAERIRELEIAVDGIPSYQKKISNQESQIAELNDVITEQQKQKTELEGVLVAQRKKGTALEEVIAEQQKKRTELERVISEQQKKRTELEEVIVEQQKKRSELEEVIAHEQKKVANMEELVETLQKDLNEARGDATKRGAQLATLQGDLEDLMVKALPDALSKIHEGLKERVRVAGDDLALKDVETNLALEDGADEEELDVSFQNSPEESGLLVDDLEVPTNHAVVLDETVTKHEICDDGTALPMPPHSSLEQKRIVGPRSGAGTPTNRSQTFQRLGRSPQPPQVINIRVGSPAPPSNPRRSAQRQRNGPPPPFKF